MEFVFIVILACAQLGASEHSNEISSIFEGFGYSPVCVATALASCENSSQKDFDKNVTSAIPSFELSSISTEYYKHINDSLRLIISGLQEIEKKTKPTKHEREKLETHTDFYKTVMDSLAQITTSLQEIKPKKRLPRNCKDILESGDCESGVRTIYPGTCVPPVNVYCDQSTDGGGWTLFQKRDALPVRENFFRTWKEYVVGFGNLTGEFWLGLDNIFALTQSARGELRIDLEDYEGGKRWAKYGSFSVGDSSSKYQLSIGVYTGDAGDGLGHHNGMKYRTRDQDNDLSADNCAEIYKGAWWYTSGHSSNMIGLPHVGNHASYADGIQWKPFRGLHYSLKMTSMKVRPTNVGQYNLV